MNERNAVYRGIVIEPEDPKGRGRVKVSVPTFDEQVWAARATLDAGDSRGTWFVPDSGDEVLVAFEEGDARTPVVVGAVWGETQRPPEHNPEHTLIRTKHGATVLLDDDSDAIEVSDVHGNVVKLAADGVTIRSASKLAVQASIVEIEAGTVKVDASISEFSGLVQCDTLATNSVIARGAGTPE